MIIQYASPSQKWHEDSWTYGGVIPCAGVYEFQIDLSTVGTFYTIGAVSNNNSGLTSNVIRFPFYHKGMWYFGSIEVGASGNCIVKAVAHNGVEVDLYDADLGVNPEVYWRRLR